MQIDLLRQATAPAVPEIHSYVAGGGETIVMPTPGLAIRRTGHALNSNTLWSDSAVPLQGYDSAVHPAGLTLNTAGGLWRADSDGANRIALGKGREASNRDICG